MATCFSGRERFVHHGIGIAAVCKPYRVCQLVHHDGLEVIIVLTTPICCTAERMACVMSALALAVVAARV